MDRLIPTIIVAGVIVLAFVGMYAGWRALSRRNGDLAPLAGVPAEIGNVTLVAEGLYVATTVAGHPLERVTASGLGFRSRCTVTVSETGIAIALTGRAPFFVPRSVIRAVDTATWAIDKAVEPGGLVVISWLLGKTGLDSYFRMDGDSRRMLDAASQILEGLE